jgi:hypothetical protein
MATCTYGVASNYLERVDIRNVPPRLEITRMIPAILDYGSSYNVERQVAEMEQILIDEYAEYGVWRNQIAFAAREEPVVDNCHPEQKLIVTAYINQGDPERDFPLPRRDPVTAKFVKSIDEARANIGRSMLPAVEKATASLSGVITAPQPTGKHSWDDDRLDEGELDKLLDSLSSSYSLMVPVDRLVDGDLARRLRLGGIFNASDVIDVGVVGLMPYTGLRNAFAILARAIAHTVEMVCA